MAAHLRAQGHRVLAPDKTTIAEADRREESRYKTDDSVMVEIGPQNVVPAVILDVSRSGLRLLLPAPLPRGAMLKIMLAGNVIIFGEVRYCRRKNEGVHAGILIHDALFAQNNPGDRLAG